MIRCAFFDIGNVLLFFSHEKMCRQLAEVYGCSARRIRSLLFDSGLANDYDLGRLTTEEVFGSLGSTLERTVDLLEVRRAAAEIFVLNVDMLPIIEELRRRSVRLILLSNTCEVHSTYFLERFEILRCFDDRVLSHEVGLRKPEEGFFREALRRSGLEPEECLFVDDIEEYVEAAGALRISARLFRGAEDLRQYLHLR